MRGPEGSPEPHRIQHKLRHHRRFFFGPPSARDGRSDPFFLCPVSQKITDRLPVSDQRPWALTQAEPNRAQAQALSAFLFGTPSPHGRRSDPYFLRRWSAALMIDSFRRLI